MPDLDQRVREVLRSVADGLVPPRTLEELAFRRLRRRLMRHRIVGGVVSAAVLAGVVIVPMALRDSGRDGGSVVAGPRPGPLESEIVAAMDGQVVVLSPADGHVVRTLGAETPNLAASDVTATPDGETVYLQRGEQCGGEVPSIWRVRAAGGPPVPLVAPGTPGAYPLVSPDGRWLAYTTSGAASPGDCGPFDTVVVRDLAGGSEQRLDYSPTGAVVPLAWAPDSSSVVVLLNQTADGQFADVTIAVASDGLQEVARVVAPRGLPSSQSMLSLWPRLDGYGFLVTGEPVTAYPTQTGSRIATFDPVTGEERRTLTEVAEPLILVAVDASGSEFLLSGRDRPNADDLYRVRVGEAMPVKLASNVKSAAWLRVPDPSDPLPATTEASEIQVRDVRALDPNTARRELEDDGFTVDVEYRTGTDRPGLVVAQRPEPGASAARGSAVTIVVGAFEPCGGYLSPTELPEGFDPESRTGPAPEAAARGVPENPPDQVIVHYTDGRGRSIEIRRPATLFVEILGRDDEPPDAYVLGQPVQIAPIAPTIDEPLLALFSFPDGSPDDPCTSYSVNGYGVTEAELRTFAESLFPVP